MAFVFLHGSLASSRFRLEARLDVLTIRSAKKRLQTVVVLMADRVGLVVMAPGALESEPEQRPAHLERESVEKDV